MTSLEAGERRAPPGWLAVVVGLGLAAVLVALGAVGGADAPARGGSPLPAADGPEATRLGYGAMTAAQGDPAAIEAAIGLFRQGLEHDPLHPGAAFGLGWALQAESQLGEALRWYLAADVRIRLTARAHDIEYFTHNNLAWLYDAAGRSEEAELELLYAQRIAPGAGAGGLGEAETVAERTVHDLAWNALTALRGQAPSSPALEAYRSGMQAWQEGQTDVAQGDFVRALLLAAGGRPGQ